MKEIDAAVRIAERFLRDCDVTAEGGDMFLVCQALHWTAADCRYLRLVLADQSRQIAALTPASFDKSSG